MELGSGVTMTRHELFSKLNEDTMLSFPYLINYDSGRHGVITFELVAGIWELGGEIKTTYSPGYRTHGINIDFDDGNGKQCLSFFLAPEMETKRICSNGVGAPRRSSSHTNSIGRALDVLVDVN